MDKNPGTSDQKNLFLVMILCVLALVGGDFLVRMIRGPQEPTEQPAPTRSATTQTHSESASNAVNNTGMHKPFQEAPLPLGKALDKGPRLHFKTASLQGSFNLKGAFLDDAVLRNYQETVDPKSPLVRLLSPHQTETPYYVGWVWHTDDPTLQSQLPNAQTVWKAQPLESKPGTWEGRLTWTSPNGLAFEKDIRIDAKGMIHADVRVTNKTGTPATLRLVQKAWRAPPKTEGQMLVHEGFVGYVGGAFQEVGYDKIKDSGTKNLSSARGWLGITDKYWLVALAPVGQTATQMTFEKPGDFGTKGPVHPRAPFSVSSAFDALSIPAGGTISIPTRVFAGAKNLNTLDAYEKSENIPHFDLAVDFGWFYFLTKPMTYVLVWLNKNLGSMALTILVFTILLKILFFPLANRSYRSMARMKVVAPKIEEIRKRLKGDPQRMGQEVMAIYKREKVNPVSGIFLMLLNIPFFFGLYKVLAVSIEVRHAPFWGWIRDLSAPDPTNLFNLFGLLPFNTPDFMQISLWTCLMAGSMVLQTSLSPATTDKTQRNIMMFGMPIMFAFFMKGFSAGVLIYWTFQNLFGMAQQWFITQRLANAPQSNK